MGALIPHAGNNLSVYEAPDNPWAEAAAAVESGAFLKFNGNTGEYTYGADDVALEYGSQLVADLFNVSFGWICWKDSEPVEELLVKILDGKPPLEHQLPDHGPYDSNDDGWREATALPMVLLCNGLEDETEAGTKLLFKGSSASSTRGVRKLSGQFGKLFREHQGQFPVIEISGEQFAAREKKFGKKHAPILKIVGWIGEDELAGLVGDTTEGDYEPEDQQEVETVAPTTRRAARQAEAPPVEEPVEEEIVEEEAAPAPAPRRGAAAEAAPRARRTPAPAVEDDLPAPPPRGRSEGRSSAAAPTADPAPAAGGRRVRRF